MKNLINMKVRAEQQALAKWGLNFVIDKYLPKKLKDSKNKTTTAVADEIRQKLEMSIPQLTVDFGQVIGDMLGDLMSSVQPIEIKVFGSDVKTLQILSKQIAAEIKQVDGTVDVNDGVIVAGPTLSIIPNTYTLSQLGLTANDLQLQLQNRGCFKITIPFR